MLRFALTPEFDLTQSKGWCRSAQISSPLVQKCLWGWWLHVLVEVGPGWFFLHTSIAPQSRDPTPSSHMEDLSPCFPPRIKSIFVLLPENRLHTKLTSSELKIRRLNVFLVISQKLRHPSWLPYFIWKEKGTHVSWQSCAKITPHCGSRLRDFCKERSSSATISFQSWQTFLWLQTCSGGRSQAPFSPSGSLFHLSEGLTEQLSLETMIHEDTHGFPRK